MGLLIFFAFQRSSLPLHAITLKIYLHNVMIIEEKQYLCAHKCTAPICGMPLPIKWNQNNNE